MNHVAEAGPSCQKYRCRRLERALVLEGQHGSTLSDPVDSTRPVAAIHLGVGRYGTMVQEERQCDVLEHQGRLVGFTY